MTEKQIGWIEQRPSNQFPGSISRGDIYRVDEAKARAGWREAAFRAARRRGLKVHRCGKRIYVTGADLADFITRGEGRPSRNAAELVPSSDSAAIAAN